MKNSISLFGAVKGFTSQLFLVLFAFFTTLNVWGQTSANYTFNFGPSSLNSMTGSTSLMSGVQDDLGSSVFPIGFNFVYMGSLYSHISVNSNGQARLHSNSSATALGSSSISTYSASTVTLAPMAGDNEVGNGMSYLVTGVAPNRKLIVEWNNFYAHWTDPAVSGNMQLVLYETSGAFEFIYGNIINSSSSSVTRSIYHSSGNTANSSAFVALATTPTVNTSATSPSTNSIAASVSIANLANRVFTFTPNVVSVAGPTNLSFTNVTPSSMTLNWTESTPTSGIVRYVVQRSTDGGATYISNTNVALGTSTLNVTGLLPNTTYTYRVIAVSEGVESSTSTNGTQATLPPTAYTWNPTSGSSSWVTPTNWSPNRNTTDVSDILNFSNGGSSIVTNIPTQTVGSIVFSNNTQANFQAASTATLTSGGLTIGSGSVLLSNGTAAALTIAFSSSAVNTINGVLEVSNSGMANSINFTNSVTTISSTGVLAAGGTTAGTLTGTTSTLIINGTYEHKYTTVSGTIPTATWSSTSNCNILGYTAASMVPGGIAQTFGNFTWNCTGQGTNNYNFSSSSTTSILGTFSVLSTGASGSLRWTGTSSYTLNVNNYFQSGGIFDLSSGTSGSGMSMNITGTFNQSGGTFLSSGTVTNNPTVQFNGTTNQSVSFATQPTGPITFRISNPLGITLTGPSANFIIGNGTSGGLRISTTASSPIAFGGSTTALQYNALNSTLTYDASTNMTAGATEFPSVNGPANFTVNIGNANTLNVPFSRTISGTLTMSSGNIDISSNNLTIGISSSTLGSLSWTAGTIRVTTGSLTRWFGTGSLPTTAGTAVGYFPLASGTNNRNVSIYFNSATALTTAGTITIGHNNSIGLTTISSVTDVAYTINTRTNSNWSVTTGNGIAGAGTVSMRLTGGGMFNTGAVANIRLMQANSIVGTHATGTGTTPNFQALRTGLTLAQLANNHFIGAASADIQLVFNSIASGDWNNPSTWDAGIVPTCNGLVNILNGYSVTVNSSLNQSGVLTINQGGTLNVNSGDLTVGCTNSNNSLLDVNGGTLNVSGGILNVNGKFAVGANVNSVFIQSGGSVIVDGNSGTLATSIDGHIVDMYCHTTSTLQLTGGTFTVIDPTLSANASNCSFKVYPNIAHSSGPNWTLILGNGVSNNPGGHSGGFLINLTNTNSYAIGGTVILNSPWAANRFVTTTNAIPLNNLTITKGDWRTTSALHIAGNLTNNDTLTNATAGTLILSNFSGTTASVSANAQTISGTGFFRNSTVNSSKTADLIGLTINNNNATGVTIGVPLSISGTLTMTSGIINTTQTNILTLGTATLAGTLSCTPSSTNFINGPFTRTFPIRTATGTYTVATLFPVGVSNSSLPIYIDPTTTAVTKFTARAFNTMPGTSGAGVSNLASVYWSAIPDNSSNVPSSRIQLNHSGISSTTKLLYSQLNNGAYEGTPGGSSSVSAMSVTSAMGISPYYNFYSYGDLVTCSTPTDQASALSTSNKTTTSFTGTITPASSNPTGYLVVRYASGATPTAPSNNTLYTVGAAIGAGSARAIVYSSPFQFNESSLTSGITYDYYVYAFNNSGCAGPTYNTTSPLMSSVTTCGGTVSAPTTIASTALPFTNLSSNGFTINWVNPTTVPTAPNTLPQDYLLDVSTNSGFTSFVPGFENFNMGANPPYSVTGLAAGTTYFVRIKGNDNGCSSSTLAFNHIATLGSSSVTSFNFNFDNGTSGTSTIWPSGVARYRPVGTTTEYVSLSTSYASSQTNSVYMYGTSSYSQQGILVLPSVSNSNAGTHRINFKYLVSIANVVGQFGYLSTPSDPSTFVQIGNNFSNATTLSWLNINIPLPNTLPQNITLAFRTNGSVTGGIYFDDIIYEAIPVPTITNITSTVACGNSTLVTITGTELANASVSIGGTTISLTSNTSTQISATVNTTFSGTVQVTTAGGTATSSTSITFTAAPSLTINSGSQSNCTGVSNTALTTLTSNASSYSTYTWSPSTNISGDETNGWTFNPTSTTTYTLTATNGSGCTNSVAKVVTVNASPSAVSLTPNSTQNLCLGSVQSIVSSGGFVTNNQNIGTSTTVNSSTSYPSPYSNYYGGVKHQMLIRASELSALGLSSGSVITSISFNISSVGTTFSGSLSNFQIDMAHTLSTVLNSSSFESGLTNVLPAATVSIPTTGLPAIKTHTLTIPFTWNGTSNLVIQTSYSNANSGTSTDFVVMTQSDPGFVSTNWYRVDSQTAASVLSAATPTSSGNARPNMILNVSTPTQVTFTPSTDLYTDLAATIAYTGNPTTVYSKPTANRTYTATATTAAGCTASSTVTINVGAPTQQSVASTDYIWKGTTSSAWGTLANWTQFDGTVYTTPSVVPSSTSVVVIPANNTCVQNQPAIGTSAIEIQDFKIESGATTTLNSGAKLTISGTLTNNGTLTLESGATLVQGASSTLAGTGTYNVKQDITGANNGSAPSGRFWYLGSPVSLASSSAYFTSNAANVVKKRDEVNNAWTALSNGTPENLVVGRGYYTQAMGNATINFTGGLLNNGAITIGNLTRTAGQGFEGFNLVSNPYPSYLDWDAVTKTDVGNTMWYRTASGSTAGSMVFDTYVAGTGGIGTNLNGAGVSNLIPPMQSFWVRVNSGSTTGSLGLTNSMRAHFTSINGSVAGLKSTSNERDLFLRMNLLQADKKDQLIIYVNGNATNGFDQFDGEKMMQAGMPQFYTSTAGKKITINGLNSAKKQQALPVTLELPTTGVHSFVIEDLEIDNGLVWLEDKQEEIMQALEPGTVYEFYANSGINTERFVLHFQLIDNTTPINVYNEVNGSANFSGKGASVHAESAGVVVIKLPATTEGITDIQIRDAAGKLIYTGSTNTLETSVQLEQANGIYYVTLNSASGVEVRKVFIQQ